MIGNYILFIVSADLYKHFQVFDEMTEGKFVCLLCCGLLTIDLDMCIRSLIYSIKQQLVLTL